MPEAQSDLCAALECLLFVGREPVPASRLAEVLDVPLEQIPALITQLRERLDGRGLHVLALAGGYSLATRDQYAEAVRRFLEPQPEQLSRQALETLAIVAYRQPLTRPQIEQIRGVNCAGALRSLLERNLIRVSGREEAPGRPFIFVTTQQFLSIFGLDSLEDLPPLTGEAVGLMAESLGQPPSAAAPAEEEEEPFDFEA